MIGCTNDNDISRLNKSTDILCIRADADQTTAGGIPISLAVDHNMKGESVTWDIDPQSPGKLDQIMGNSVRYLPPAAGSITSKTHITITVTVNDITQHIELIVQPWPAAILNVQLGGKRPETEVTKLA